MPAGAVAKGFCKAEPIHRRAPWAGDNEGFLSFCADDLVWSIVGAETLHGKEAVREWMKKAYVQPPRFTVHKLIADEDFVAALGDITAEGKDGISVDYAYCDVWRFSDGKMSELKACVIQSSST